MVLGLEAGSHQRFGTVVGVAFEFAPPMAVECSDGSVGGTSLEVHGRLQGHPQEVEKGGGP